jgi:hypothetical protein
VVTSCTAVVGDAWIGVSMRFMKVAKKYTARIVSVSDDLLMGFIGGYGCIA